MTFWTWASDSPYLTFLLICVVSRGIVEIIIGGLETVEILLRGYPPVTPITIEEATDGEV